MTAIITPRLGQELVFPPLLQVPANGRNRRNSDSSISYTSTHGNQTANIAEYVLQNQVFNNSTEASHSFIPKRREITITIPRNNSLVKNISSFCKPGKIISLTGIISGVALFVLGVRDYPVLILFGAGLTFYSSFAYAIAKADGNC